MIYFLLQYRQNYESVTKCNFLSVNSHHIDILVPRGSTHRATRKAIVENQKLRHQGRLFQHGFAFHASQFSAVLLFT